MAYLGGHRCQQLRPAPGTGRHRTAVAFAGAAVLLLSAAASVSCVIGGLGPFDTSFESPETAHNNQQLAAHAPALTSAVRPHDTLARGRRAQHLASPLSARSAGR